MKNYEFLKALFKKYKTVIRFIGLFMGTYFALSLLYGFYLKSFLNESYLPDFITNTVARQSKAILEGFGYNIVLSADIIGEGILLTIENDFTVSIVEGCNSVSVIVLFISFIIAFADKLKKTVLYLFAGSVLIYIANLLRIVILVVALYKYPQYEALLHSVVFPGIIYSTVFILWMYWVWIIKPR